MAIHTRLFPSDVIAVAQCGPCEKPFTYGGAVILAEWDGQAAHVCPSCARLHGGRTGRDHAEAAGHALRTLAAIDQQHARRRPAAGRSRKFTWDERKRRWIEHVGEYPRH